MLKDRLDLIVKELGLSGRKFEKACGLANGSYTSISDGVGADKLKKILIKYPQISAEWLLTGEGLMFRSLEVDNSSKPDQQQHISDPDMMGYLMETNKKLMQMVDDLQKTNKLLLEENTKIMAKLDELEKISDRPAIDPDKVQPHAR